MLTKVATTATMATMMLMMNRGDGAATASAYDDDVDEVVDDVYEYDEDVDDD